MPSRSPSPLIRSPIDKNSPFNDKNPANTVSIFKKNKLLKKKNAFEIKKLKRMGFLKKEIKKREDSLDENPFHALMWRNIKKVRKKQEVYQEKFEDVLLRIALDRKEKFYDLVIIFFIIYKSDLRIKHYPLRKYQIHLKSIKKWHNYIEKKFKIITKFMKAILIFY